MRADTADQDRDLDRLCVPRPRGRGRACARMRSLPPRPSWQLCFGLRPACARAARLPLREGLLHVLDKQPEVEVDKLHHHEHLRRASRTSAVSPFGTNNVELEARFWERREKKKCMRVAEAKDTLPML
eukprot:5361036-Pleurochrysis_carterae.AAC.6